MFFFQVVFNRLFEVDELGGFQVCNPIVFPIFTVLEFKKFRGKGEELLNSLGCVFSFWGINPRCLTEFRNRIF